MRPDLQVNGPHDAVELAKHLAWVLDHGKGTPGVGAYRPRVLRCPGDHTVVEKWSDPAVSPDGRSLIAWVARLVVNVESVGGADGRPIVVRRTVQHVAWLDELVAKSIQAQCRCRTVTVDWDQLVAL